MASRRGQRWPGESFKSVGTAGDGLPVVLPQDRPPDLADMAESSDGGVPVDDAHAERKSRAKNVEDWSSGRHSEGADDERDRRIESRGAEEGSAEMDYTLGSLPAAMVGVISLEPEGMSHCGSVRSVKVLGFRTAAFAPRRSDWEALVETKYKRKDKKVQSANVPLPRDIHPIPSVRLAESVSLPNGSGGSNNVPHGGKTVPRGSRLTPERLAKMMIGGNFLSEQEKQLFIDILFEFEGAIAFDESEMGLLHESM